MHQDQTSEESSSQVEEGAAVQRHGRNHAVVVIGRRKVSVVKIFRILDDISNLFLLLRYSRGRPGSRGRFLRDLDEVTPWIFTHFGLGRITPNYFDDLSKSFDHIRS
jgi:hypothetical protein